MLDESAAVLGDVTSALVEMHDIGSSSAFPSSLGRHPMSEESASAFDDTTAVLNLPVAGILVEPGGAVSKFDFSCGESAAVMRDDGKDGDGDADVPEVAVRGPGVEQAPALTGKVLTLVPELHSQKP